MVKKIKTRSQLHLTVSLMQPMVAGDTATGDDQSTTNFPATPPATLDPNSPPPFTPEPPPAPPNDVPLVSTVPVAEAPAAPPPVDASPITPPPPVAPPMPPESTTSVNPPAEIAPAVAPTTALEGEPGFTFSSEPPPPPPPTEPPTYDSLGSVPRKKRSAKILTMIAVTVFIALTIPVVVFLAKRNQDIRQKAAWNPTCSGSWTCTKDTQSFTYQCAPFNGQTEAGCTGGNDVQGNFCNTAEGWVRTGGCTWNSGCSPEGYAILNGQCYALNGMSCGTYCCNQPVDMSLCNNPPSSPNPSPSPDTSPSPGDLPPGDGPVCNPIGQVEYECPDPPGNNNKCHQCGSNNQWIQTNAPGCQTTDPNYFFCNACDTALYPNRVCYSATPSGSPNPAAQINYSDPNCLGVANTGNLDLNYTTRRCVCQGSVGACDTANGGTCNNVSQGVITPGQSLTQTICYAGPTSCTSEQIDLDVWYGSTNVTGGGIIRQSSVQGEACTSASPSPGVTAQCTNLNIYQVTGDITQAGSWQLLDSTQLSALQPGAIIYATTKGTVTGGAFDKARIRINPTANQAWNVGDETTLLKPKVNVGDLDEYYVSYTIPNDGTITFSFESEIHEPTQDKWF